MPSQRRGKAKLVSCQTPKQGSEPDSQEGKDDASFPDPSEFGAVESNGWIFIDEEVMQELKRDLVLGDRWAKPRYRPRRRSERKQNPGSDDNASIVGDDEHPLAMVRVLVLGCGEKEVKMARHLAEHDRVCGVYFLPDGNEEGALRMRQWAHEVELGHPWTPEDVSARAEWLMLDYVFHVTPRATSDDDTEKKLLGEEVERQLAELRVTLVDEGLCELILKTPSPSLDALFQSRDAER